MLLGLRGAESPNSTGEIQPAPNHPWSSKVNPIFIITALWLTLNLSPRKWTPSNEKEQGIKSSTCTRHRYDKLFIGGLVGKMELVICFMIYRLNFCPVRRGGPSSKPYYFCLRTYIQGPECSLVLQPNVFIKRTAANESLSNILHLAKMPTLVCNSSTSGGKL